MALTEGGLERQAIRQRWRGEKRARGPRPSDEHLIATLRGVAREYAAGGQTGRFNLLSQAADRIEALAKLTAALKESP